MLYKMSLATLYTIMVIWVRIKYTFFDTKSTIVITVLNSVDSESFTTKLILIVFYLVFGIGSGCSSPSCK